jgi:hypothetical protein
MRTVIALAVVISGRVAAAYPGGALRIDVTCADYWATPERGLTVAVDGVSYPALGENGMSGFELAVYHHIATPIWTWTPTDIGYSAAVGPHHISVAAPGCAPLDADVTIGPLRPAVVTGRLPISDSMLSGPTGAPNGFGITIGAFTRAQPSHASTNDLFSAAYTFDSTTVQGAAVSTSVEHRALAVAWDFAFGTAASSGTSAYEGDFPTESHTPIPFTGDEYAMRGAFRIGARLPLQEVALAGGAGLGGDVVITSETAAQNGSLALPPSGVDADWFIPLWAQLTIKPSCNWGAQLYASYDVHPTASGESAPEFGAGIMYQPSAACSDPAGLVVR